MLSSLTQRAALQANVLMPDGGGGHLGSWQTFALVWVKITPLGASETFGPDVLESRARHRVLLRRRDDVEAGQRLAVDNRSFRIRAVLDPDSRATFMTLLCEELP